MRKRKTPTSLTGLFLLTFDSDGNVEKQGEIIGRAGRYLLVQLYEWVLGYPTCIIRLKTDKLDTPEVRLYADEKLWRESAGEYIKSASAWRRAHETAAA